jgi:hypothetical protein
MNALDQKALEAAVRAVMEGGSYEVMARAAITAYLAVAEAVEPVAWQVIDENTPRDGTRILLAKIVGHPDHETALWWATVGHWSSKWNNWNDGIEPAGLVPPTHWLPVTAYGVGFTTALSPDLAVKGDET